MYVHFLSLFPKLQESPKVTNNVQFDFFLINLFLNRYYMSMVKKKLKVQAVQYNLSPFHHLRKIWNFPVFFCVCVICYRLRYWLRNIISCILFFSPNPENEEQMCEAHFTDRETEALKLVRGHSTGDCPKNSSPFVSNAKAHALYKNLFFHSKLFGQDLFA